MTVTSLLPPQLGSFLDPAIPQSGLLDGEDDLISALSTKLAFQTPFMQISQLYYDGLQRVADLGIAIPPQLASVRTVVDWPRICVDPLVMRAVVDGFRLPASKDVDADLQRFWQANSLDSEFSLCAQDSLTLGRGYMIVGAPDSPGDAPIITVESPFNLVMNWDPRSRAVTAAYQAYEAEGIYQAVLYLPDVTVSMSRTESKQWAVDDRDEHRFGEVPVVRFPNRARSSDREGRSEITASIKNTTDSATRTLLGMEIAREFYSVPHRFILGASEDDFVDAEGNQKAAIDMVMSKFAAFERDENGDMPTVGQFQAFDPSVFEKMLEGHAKRMASFTGYPADYFGVTTTANPASADAIRSAQDGLNRRGRQVQNQFSDPLERVMCLAWRFANNGQTAPDAMSQLETDWFPVETPTPSATADAMLKQKQSGFVTSGSRVALKKLNYTDSEIDELLADQKASAADELVSEVASDLEATQLRTLVTVEKDAAAPPLPPGVAPAAPVTP